MLLIYTGNSSSSGISQPTRSHRKVDNVASPTSGTENWNPIDWQFSHGTRCFGIRSLLCPSGVSLLWRWENLQRSSNIRHFQKCFLQQFLKTSFVGDWLRIEEGSWRFSSWKNSEHQLGVWLVNVLSINPKRNHLRIIWHFSNMQRSWWNRLNKQIFIWHPCHILWHWESLRLASLKNK